MFFFIFYPYHRLKTRIAPKDRGMALNHTGSTVSLGATFIFKLFYFVEPHPIHKIYSFFLLVA